jgi:hypothetical protein
VPSKPFAFAAIVISALVAPLTGHAQAASDSALVYEREVFSYDRGGRPDPFRSLLTNAELGVRLEDLTLLGVVYHPDPSRSVAVIAQRGAERRIRVRVGERVGSIRIAAIHQRSIDVVVEEFGVARRETLQIRTAP